MGVKSQVQGACSFSGKPLVGDGGSRLAMPGSTPASFPDLGPKFLAALCPMLLSVLSSSATEPEGAFVGLPMVTDPRLLVSLLHVVFSFPKQIAEVGADGLPVVERATCPTPSKESGSGLRAWASPERVSLCVY